MSMGSACLGISEKESAHVTSIYTCLWISSPWRDVTTPIGDYVRIRVRSRSRVRIQSESGIYYTFVFVFMFLIRLLVPPPLTKDGTPGKKNSMPAIRWQETHHSRGPSLTKIRGKFRPKLSYDTTTIARTRWAPSLSLARELVLVTAHRTVMQMHSKRRPALFFFLHLPGFLEPTICGERTIPTCQPSLLNTG
jgi:hypothetical protein